MPTIHDGLLPTALDKLVLQYPTGLDTMNHRKPIVGALDAFKADSNLLLTPQAVRQIETSIPARPVKIPVMESKDVTIITQRGCTIACGANDSNLVDVTFATVGFTICQQPSFFENNHISLQQDFDLQLLNGLKSLAKNLDATAITTLENKKNTFFNAATLARYAAVGGVLQVPQANKTSLYNNIPSILATQNFDADMVRVICNPFHMADVREQYNQGTYNSVNLAYQFGMFDYYQSNNITDAAGSESTLFTSLRGSLGLYNRNPFEARNRERITESERWEERLFPLVDLKMAVYYKANCEDVDGFPQSKVNKWEISTDVCFLTPHFTTPVSNPTSIMKFAILS